MASQQQLDRLKAVVPAAQLCATLYGVPASVTLAQWILESSWGASGLTLKANNCFGVKYSQKAGDEAYVEIPTAEYESGKRVMIEAQFVKYASCADSFKGHALLLSKLLRYRPAMKDAHIPRAFAVDLQKCGYSTNPHYGDELLGLMHEYDLAQYDVPQPTEPAAQMKEAA